jgi:hypothetical protein
MTRREPRLLGVTEPWLALVDAEKRGEG